MFRFFPSFLFVFLAFFAFIPAAQTAASTPSQNPAFVHRIGGVIDTATLADFLRQIQPAMAHGRLVLMLDSPGGNMAAANGIADFVDHLGRQGVVVTTHIGVGGRCHSACVTIYASGNRRTAAPSASLGVHALRDADTGRLNSAANDRFIAYLAARGVDQNWLAGLSRQGSFDRLAITAFAARDLLATGLVHDITG
ncbi:MAG: hypothetical protein AAGF58_04215 [Pseudomonadota bacterium]